MPELKFSCSPKPTDKITKNFPGSSTWAYSYRREKNSLFHFFQDQIFPWKEGWEPDGHTTHLMNLSQSKKI